MRESELVIMIAVRDRRDAWVGPSCLTRTDYEASLGWSAIFIESEMALLPECMESYVQKIFDTADIVREAIFHTNTSRSDTRHFFPVAVDFFQ
jgi:hypothetical protein